MDNRLFDEFSITTEHFYDELGKLSECESFFSRKELKHLRKKIISLLFDAIDTLFRKENVTNKVERHELKKEHNAYKAENNTGFTNKVKKLLSLTKGKDKTDDITLIEIPVSAGNLPPSQPKEGEKDGDVTDTGLIEANEPAGQLPPSQPEETQTESVVNAEGEQTIGQETEKKSQDKQNEDV